MRRIGTLRSRLSAVVDRIKACESLDALSALIREPDVIRAVEAALPRPRVFLSAFQLARWPHNVFVDDEGRALFASAAALVRLFLDAAPFTARRARALLRSYAHLLKTNGPRALPRALDALVETHRELLLQPLPAGPLRERMERLRARLRSSAAREAPAQ